MIDVQGLTKKYGDFTALNSCDIQIQKGEVVGLLGPNGSGKTTLIRLLMGFQRPTAGVAKIDGLDCYEQRVQVHRRVSYLPGDARLYRSMRAKSVLKFFADLREDGNFERSLELADFLELDIRRRVAFMSTGMRQKLAASICLSINAPLVILDEPTANLDPTVRSRILELVQQAADRKQTVLLSSHVLSEIEAVCSRVILLRAGNKVFEGMMEGIQQTHLVTARLNDPKKLPVVSEELAENISLSVVRSDGRVEEISKSANANDVKSAGQVKLTVNSLDDEVLKWLGNQDFHELKIQPMGLQAIYDQYHGRR